MFLPVLALLFQGPGPTLPAGVSTDFQARVLKVETALEASDFAAAEKLVNAMPDSTIVASWDDSAVPAADRSEFVRARELGFGMWTRQVPGAEVKIGTGGLLSFRFKTGSEAMSLSYQPDGRLVATIPLSRGEPPQPITASTVQSDVARALGELLGVGRLPIGSTVMTPMETVTKFPYLLPRPAAVTAAANLEAIRVLRSAVAAKQRLTRSSSEISIAKSSFELGETLQGDKKEFQIELENRGNAPLELWVRPECGCMTLDAPDEIAPHTKGVIPVSFDPTEFRGRIEKKVFIVSNDPQNPLTSVDMSLFVRPAFQFITPHGPVIVTGDKGGKGEIFVTFNGGETFGIRRIILSGVPGSVDFDPWEGSLADPSMGEPAKAREGYKLTISITGNLPPGRSPSSVMILTDNEKYPMIQCQIYAQKGIVAVPDELFVGDLGTAKNIKFLVSRPGRPFKIIGVTSDSPNVKVTVKPGSNGQEYVLEAAYDGKGDLTGFPSSLTVKTDDPKQPIVKVPLIALGK